MARSSRVAMAIVLAVGIVGTGLLVAGVSAAGYRTFGSALWVVGYSTTVVVLWWGWVRPLDLGPDTDAADRGN